jgi:PAS domain S-box-containing protein
MPTRRHVARSAVVRYGLAIVSVAATVGVALWLRPVVLAAGQLSLVAILLVGWVCGLRPALAAWILATLAFAYYFTPPFDSLRIAGIELPRLVIFALLGLLMAIVSAARRRAHDALQRARHELEARVHARTADLERSNQRLEAAVAERERMLADLRESEARLEQAQRIAHVGYWDYDVDTGRVTWSDETYRIFGVTPSTPLPSSLEVSNLIHLHPDDRARVKEALAEAARGGRRYDVEYRLVQPGRSVRTVHSQADLVRDETGRARRFFGVVHDITDRRRAEDALQRAQAELAHVTRVTTLGQLAASIAHEVNQPLAAIVADANAALNWLSVRRGDLERVRESLDAIVTEGHRAAEVIQRIRQLATKSTPHKACVDVNEVIADIVRLVRAELLRHHVDVGLELAPVLPPVLGDRVQLQQVLINLVVNAVEAMASVADRPRGLTIRSRADDADHVTVAVHDTGIGLDLGQGDQLFSAFFTTKPAGMGMGLSISRSIVEAHGGRLWATRNEPHGAIFHVSLPVRPDPTKVG